MRLSASKIKTFMGCGQKARFRYEDKVEAAIDSNNLTYGSALHESLELLIEGVNIHDASPVGEGVLKEKLTFKEGDRWSLDEFLMMFGTHLSQFKNWLDHTALEPKTLAVEESVEVGLGEHSLYGILDWVIEKKDGTVVIIDHKTTTSVYPESFTARDIQLTLYQILGEQMYPGRKVEVGYTQFVKRKLSGRKGPEMIKPSFMHRSNAEKNELLHLAQFVATNMENKMFPIPATHAFNSPCGMCEYEEHCLKQKNVELWEGRKKKTGIALAF